MLIIRRLPTKVILKKSASSRRSWTTNAMTSSVATTTKIIDCNNCIKDRSSTTTTTTTTANTISRRRPFVINNHCKYYSTSTPLFCSSNVVAAEKTNTPKVTVTKSSSQPSSSNNDNNDNDNDNVDDDNIDNDEDDDDGKYKLPNIEKEMIIRKKQLEVRNHYEHGIYDKALECSKELLDLSKNHFGHDHPATATSYNQIGLMYKELGEYKKSKLNYHESLRIYERVVGKDHSSYAAALHNVGNLHKVQVNLDETLSNIDRIQINEVAIEYLEEAYNIRQLELGIEHPYTISSQSSLGSTIATQVLQQQELILNNKNKNKNKNNNSKRPVTSSRLTKKRWELAEKHLRTSLQISINNPRGESILDNKNSNNKTNNNNNNHNDKDDQKKKTKKQKKNNNTSTTTMKDSSKKQQESSSSETHALIEHRGQITTLSSATASQNLAVFLKCRAVSLLLNDNSSNKNNNSNNNNNNNKTLYNKLIHESKYLYEQTLKVRSILLSVDDPEQSHPDIISTKHSYAELLETCFHDKKQANKLRNEIINSHNVVEVNTNNNDSNNNDNDNNNNVNGSSSTNENSTTNSSNNNNNNENVNNTLSSSSSSSTNTIIEAEYTTTTTTTTTTKTK